jgi:malate dehydrogenase (oxaloacetate-decarboxylating)(NADP+)
MDEQPNQGALDYHRYPTPGKITVMPTKGMTNQRDLALAYSPGVAVPCLAIQKDPLAAYDYTSKGNLVAVVSNGPPRLHQRDRPLRLPQPGQQLPSAA